MGCFRRKAKISARLWMGLWVVACGESPPLQSQPSVGWVQLRDAGGRGTAAQADGGPRDAGVPLNTGMADAGFDDAGLPDAGFEDAGFADAGFPDAGFEDAGVPDAGFEDAGIADAGFEDAGFADAGFDDAGLPDAGFEDAGFQDAGAVDAGFPDAGFADAGVFLPPPRTQANVFSSGHSLTGLDTPRMFEQVALSLAHPHQYNLQNSLGATMRNRLVNPTLQQNKLGMNPLGFSILDEIPSATILANQELFDVLVVTEASPVFQHVLYSETIEQTRAFRDLIHQSGPGAVMFLNETWPAVVQQDYPAWVTQTRFDTMKWECVLSVVNDGQTQDVGMVPSGVALADLIEALLQGQVGALDHPGEVFADHIHLRPPGHYFMGMVHYVAIYGRHPSGATEVPLDPWGAPYGGMPSSATLQALQDLAYQSVVDYFDGPEPWRHTNPACRAHFQASTTNAWEQNTVIPAIFP